MLHEQHRQAEQHTAVQQQMMRELEKTRQAGALSDQRSSELQSLKSNCEVLKVDYTRSREEAEEYRRRLGHYEEEKVTMQR